MPAYPKFNDRMEAFIAHLPEQIRDAIGIGARFPVPPDYRGFTDVLFCGMGGSAIPGDILRVLFKHYSPIPLAVHRWAEYLPSWVGRDTLVICSSYSGNTTEIIEAFEKAVRQKAKVLLVSSGGRLEAMAKKKGIGVIKIPSGMSPRCAIGYLTFSLFPVLKKIGCLSIPEKGIQECVDVLRKVSRTQARSISRKLHSKFVFLYSASGLMEPVATRWRSQLAENAKTLASHHRMPEMFHNEIQGWNEPRGVIKNSVAVFFRDIQEDPKFLRRKGFAKKVIRAEGADVLDLAAQGKEPLARIFSLIALGDWVSYELARLYNVDPGAIPTLEAIKKVH